jgi:hypothetical protein
MRTLHVPERFRRRLDRLDTDRALTAREIRAARALANETYFQELERALSSNSTT